mmetsp:Transcript_43698/g.78443  ORF Transcript_43698/g.78443 Transcript_43698/m.78443 type:complete len:107 (-) Transcript_43698:31-351(-)
MMGGSGHKSIFYNLGGSYSQFYYYSEVILNRIYVNQLLGKKFEKGEKPDPRHYCLSVILLSMIEFARRGTITSCDTLQLFSPNQNVPGECWNVFFPYMGKQNKNVD